MINIKNNKNKGFSLTEMLLVLIIIIVLSGTGFLIFDRIERKAKIAFDTRTVSMARSAAYMEYYADAIEGETALYVYDGNKIVRVTTSSENSINGYGRTPYGYWNEAYGAIGNPVSENGTPNHLYALIVDGAITMYWSDRTPAIPPDPGHGGDPVIPPDPGGGTEPDPDPNPDPTPDPGEPETSPDINPETSGDVTPETSPDVKPDTSGDVTPETSGDVTPGPGEGGTGGNPDGNHQNNELEEVLSDPQNVTKWPPAPGTPIKAGDIFYYEDKPGKPGDFYVATKDNPWGNPEDNDYNYIEIGESEDFGQVGSNGNPKIDFIDPTPQKLRDMDDGDVYKAPDGTMYVWISKNVKVYKGNLPPSTPEEMRYWVELNAQ